MAQQIQGPDPSDRIFADLRSKNEEVKYRAAGELRDLMSLLSRGMLSQMNFPATEHPADDKNRMVSRTIRRIQRQSFYQGPNPHTVARLE
jgi:hypothetical protein